MTVNSKGVQGRRDLTFRTLDDIVADAERLAASRNPATLGNWPLAQLLSHLAMTFNGSIDGFESKAPWLIRLIGPLIKGRFISAKKMSPGIKLPKAAEAAAFPEGASVQESLESLRRAVARTKTERMEAPHPAFGKMTHDEWVLLQLRHSEMHLSFALPD